MTAETCTGVDGKRDFMRDMTSLAADALDKMPLEERLALWLSCDPGLGRKGAAEALSVPVRVLDALRASGMRDLLGKLGERGVVTDDASVSALFRIMMRLPAPKTLVSRIQAIVDMPALRAAGLPCGRTGLNVDGTAGPSGPGRHRWQTNMRR